MELQLSFLLAVANAWRCQGASAVCTGRRWPLSIALCKQLVHAALAFLKEVTISESIHTYSRPARLVGNSSDDCCACRPASQQAVDEKSRIGHLDPGAD